MTATSTTTRLTLHRETLRALTPGELVLVGGGKPKNNCTGRYSGCL
jgi:hypothetical protein